MKYAVTSDEMKRYDRNTSEVFGVSTEILMERASLCVADEIEKHISSKNADRKYTALVFAGVGNNGGDGVCTARLLKQRGIRVKLVVVGDMTKCSDLCLKQLKIAANYGINADTFSNIRDNKSPAEWDIIVDALFGIGISRNITGSYAEVIDYINDCKKDRGDDLFVVSVDIPSGINADDGRICSLCVKADETVTFNCVKLGHILYPGCEYTGKLVVGDAGITKESFCGNTPEYFFYDEKVTALLPERKKYSNKGTNGKILIIAGSKEISGACALSAGACLKAGAGMVKVFTAFENAEVIKTVIPEALIDTYEDYEPVSEKLEDAMNWSTAAVVGPGIGMTGRGAEILKVVLSRYDKNLVVDADGLNLIAADKELRRLASDFGRNGKKLILTPHLAEFARLFGRDIKECKRNILFYPKELAKELHCTVICKDARSVVSDSNEKKIYINISGNDGMATAGSGDVLSGVLGALVGTGLSSFECACIGAYLHGAAGDLAAARHGKLSMVASDIVDELENILN
ncbi:NAD(P)H-hydrate dehydratase [Butyrivibrio sp. M55]|uniref:NAD(P)H-hydrate dehydratase n=1 Tax=Butyrivibrio sp. M55 TaxID=1855323 RepID=UPI0008E89E6D|nr:NAD(P)H-hydrate dehydratase [Butyrivibrio sp. M55]SFU77604.1 NAD(P)H-hydrate epimerase [Butyrivibrio sp. M55]